MTLRAWSLVVCLAVNAYLAGVMVLFATVVYPGFGAVDRAAFAAPYAAFNERIGAPVVAFEVAAFVLSFVLYALRPASTPTWLVHAVVVLGVAYFVVTFAWHLPAHRALAAGDNGAGALSAVIVSQWVRTAAQLSRLGLLAWAGARAMS